MTETPFDHGAVGDGQADDTQAMKAALAATLDLRLPAGAVFRVVEQLRPRAGARLRGGGTLRQSGYDNGLYIKGLADVAVAGITIEGAVNGVIVEACTDVRLTDLTIRSASNNGLLIDESRDVQARGCRIEGPGGHGIAVSGDGDETNPPDAGHSALIGNRITDPGSSGINVSEAEGVAIVGNVVTAASHVNGFAGVRLTNRTDRCTVSGNTIDGMGRGIFLLEACDNAVSGNTIRGATHQGILIHKADDGPDPIASDRNAVTGNVVADCGGDGIQISHGARNAVVGNVVSNAGVGIKESGAVSGNVIMGNVT